MHLRLTPKALTQSAFAPYGEVIETQNAKNSFTINYGLTTRFHDLATIDVDEKGGRAGFSIFRAKRTSLPHQVQVMEYHPYGSQLFYPVCEHPFLVLVAPPATDLEPEKIELFITNGNQGVNYYKGTWHHYLLPLEHDGDFIVIDRIANDDNCIETELSEEIIIQI